MTDAASRADSSSTFWLNGSVNQRVTADGLGKKSKQLVSGRGGPGHDPPSSKKGTADNRAELQDIQQAINTHIPDVTNIVSEKPIGDENLLALDYSRLVTNFMGNN